MKALKFLVLAMLFACSSKEDPQPTSTLPNVATVINHLTSTSVLVGGSITSDGGLHVLERGVVVDKTKIIMGEGTGEYSEEIALEPFKTYIVKAYARSAKGTRYGDAITFVANCKSDIGGIIQYSTVPIASANPIAPCPLITGTITISEDIEGRYIISDISFGFYGCVWGDDPAIGIRLFDECGILTIEGNDQYGASYQWVNVTRSGSDTVIHWQNEFADEATTTLKNWP